MAPGHLGARGLPSSGCLSIRPPGVKSDLVFVSHSKERASIPICPYFIPFTGSFLAGCKIHPLSPGDSLLCRSPSKQICIYNGFFFKTCIICLIDWNDSLGEVRHRSRQFFVVYNIHLFYMAIYFSAGLDGEKAYEEEKSCTQIWSAVYKTTSLDVHY